MIIGIDPGLKGAFIGLDKQGNITHKVAMPTISNELDLPAICKFFKKIKSQLEWVVLEKVGARPRQGVVSMFKFGKGVGALEGIISAYDISYLLVPVKTWQTRMLQGMPQGFSSKDKARLAVARWFPDADLSLRKGDDRYNSGIIDALLIAEYGRQTLYCKDQEE